MLQYFVILNITCIKLSREYKKIEIPLSHLNQYLTFMQSSVICIIQSVFKIHVSPIKMASFQRLRNIFSKKTELLIILLSAWYKKQLSIFGSYASYVNYLINLS